MVAWITGASGAGKTTLAKLLGGIVLDGDEVRHYFPTGFTDRGICKNHWNMVNIARILEKQGEFVIIAVVSRNRAHRKFFQKHFDRCVEIYMPGGTMWKGTEHEEATTGDYGPMGNTVYVDKTGFQPDEFGSARWIRSAIHTRKRLVSSEQAQQLSDPGDKLGSRQTGVPGYGPSRRRRHLSEASRSH